MAPNQNTITLANTTEGKGEHPVTLRAELASPIRRSLGAGGDSITLLVEHDEWPADPVTGWDDAGEFIVRLNAGEVDGLGNPANRLELRGYRLRAKIPTRVSNAIGDSQGTPGAARYQLTIEPGVRGLREGLGNLINDGVLNPVDAEGRVDTADPAYRDMRQLVERALSDTGLEFESPPLSINNSVTGEPIDAPGPLDWGNARPVEELESLLGRIGWALVQLNNGTLAARRLLRAGEPIVIPAQMLSVAEPFELARTPSAKSPTIVITSGATKTTSITSRTLADLEWVVYDPELDAWDPQPLDSLATYRGGIKPDTANPEGARNLGQLYRSARLKGDDLKAAARYVNIPEQADHGPLLAFAGSAGVVEALCSVKQAGDQLVNTPPLDTDPMIRIEGVRAISEAGVFVLPSSAEFVRVDGLSSGRRGDARELLDTELRITFAHESNTGDFKTDYFVTGFKWLNTNGTITVVELDPTELDAALADPKVPKLAAPWMRLLNRYDSPVLDPLSPRTTLNRTQLVEVAKQYASFYLAEGTTEAGVVQLRGIHDIDPGDWGGAVSGVLWDIGNFRTVVTVNQHEVPRSDYERLQRAAGRSVAAGIGQIRLGRSSAAGGDIRYPIVAGVGGPGSNGETATPEANASTRGRSRSAAGLQGSIDSGPRARVDIATIAEQGMILARIVGATPNGANRWLYDWEEVRIEGAEAVSTGATRTSFTHGQAINLRDANNPASGLMGNGTNSTNYCGTFALQPASPVGAVLLYGPVRDGLVDLWYFSEPNGVDGGPS